MLPNAINRIIINTGNLISYKEFKKKASQTPAEEVSDRLYKNLLFLSDHFNIFEID